MDLCLYELGRLVVVVRWNKCFKVLFSLPNDVHCPFKALVLDENLLDRSADLTGELDQCREKSVARCQKLVSLFILFCKGSLCLLKVRLVRDECLVLTLDNTVEALESVLVLLDLRFKLLLEPLTLRQN